MSRSGYGVLRIVARLALCGRRPLPAQAQSSPELARASRHDWRRQSCGRAATTSATPRRNCAATAPAPSAPPFTLFTSDSRVTSATSPELRVGFAMTPRMSRWRSARRCRSLNIGVAIAGDAEAPSQQLPGEKLEQYLFDGGVTWQLPVRLGRRLAPFVVRRRRVPSSAARRSHARARPVRSTMPVAARGTCCAAGTARRRPSALRGDVRVNFRRKGIDFEDKMRTYSDLLAFPVRWPLTSPFSSSACRRAAAAAACCDDVSLSIARRRDRRAGRAQRVGQDDPAAPDQSADRARCGRGDRRRPPGAVVGSDRAAPADRLRHPGRRAVSAHDGGVEHRDRAAPAVRGPRRRVSARVDELLTMVGLEPADLPRSMARSTVRRRASARRAGARAGGRSVAAADGRAVRRARSDHEVRAARRVQAAAGDAASRGRAGHARHGRGVRARRSRRGPARWRDRRV